MSDEHFDAVIVGSGFGGSIMAYKLAEKGLNVCLLERGKPAQPFQTPIGDLCQTRIVGAQMRQPGKTSFSG